MKTYIIKSCLAFALILTVAFPASAQEQKNEAENRMTSLHISATEMRDVPQDQLVAHLRFETENQDVSTLQNDINKVMRRALEKAQKHDQIKAETLSYNVHRYDPGPRTPRETEEDREERMIWRGSQSLQLKSKDADTLLSLVGDLQKDGMAMQNLSYSLSETDAAAIRDEMMEAALVKLDSRAKRAAAALGMTHAGFLEINVDHTPVQPPRPMHADFARAESMVMSSAPPVAAAGETNLSLSVSATARLLPADN